MALSGPQLISGLRGFVPGIQSGVSRSIVMLVAGRKIFCHKRPVRPVLHFENHPAIIERQDGMVAASRRLQHMAGFTQNDTIRHLAVIIEMQHDKPAPQRQQEFPRVLMPVRPYDGIGLHGNGQPLDWLIQRIVQIGIHAQTW